MTADDACRAVVAAMGLLLVPPRGHGTTPSTPNTRTSGASSPKRSLVAAFQIGVLSFVVFSLVWW